MNRYEHLMKHLGAEIVRARQGVKSIILQEEDLWQVENRLGCSLPPDYREFLRDYGCYELYSFFRCSCRSNLVWEGIALFYGVIPENSSPFPFDLTFDLLEIFEGLDSFKPKELLPIGGDSGANEICLVISGEDVGKVFYWNRGQVWSTTDIHDLCLVSNSFDEFMSSLKTEEEWEAEK